MSWVITNSCSSDNNYDKFNIYISIANFNTESVLAVTVLCDARDK